MLTEINDLEGDMLAMCEHNMQLNRTTKGKCYDATRKINKIKTSKLVLADNPLQTKTNFKPGGTGQVIMNNLVGRVESSSTDKLGRWVKTTFNSRLGPITVYSAYAPTASIPTTGRATNTMQQRIYYENQALKEKNMQAYEAITNQTPRQRFEEDFLKDTKAEKSKGHELIILGDLNDTMTSKKSFPQKLMRELQLIDGWEEKNPNQEEPATYFRGKQRIDHCLYTTKVARAIINVKLTPFFTIARSDHAGIVIDLDSTSLFKNKTMIQNYHERGMFSKDYTQLPVYIDKVYDHLDKNNAFKKMEQIQNNPNLDINTIEAIDTIISQACKSGEKKIKRRHRAWWSIGIHQARYSLNVTNKAIAQIKSGKYDKHALQLQLDQHSCPVELPQQMKELIKLRTELRSQVKDHIETAKEKRNEYLSEHIKTATRAGNDAQAQITKNIQRSEQVNNAYRTMAAIRKPRQNNGLNKISIPASWGSPQEALQHPETLEDPAKATQWRDINDTEQIAKYMLARNRKHFHQAYGTPLTRTPWPDLLDWAGSSEIATDILAGRYKNESLPEIQQAIFRRCTKEFQNPLVDRILSTEDMRGKLKRWRKSTSTSPSGRHLGHYRAMIQPLNFIPDPETKEAPEEYQHQILQLYTDVLNYTTKHNYILERWKIIESTMIPKDPGNTKVHRLRVIHIFEADYNLLLAVKWRELIFQLENNNGLHPDQHGSRPGHQATDLTLLEELSFDVSRCSRTSLGNFDNDASACYDRVVAKFASLASLSQGHHPSLVKLNTSALKQSKYYIRNTKTDQEAYYQHEPSYPIYGTGQGCSNSPTVWCLVSSTLFKAHQDISNGASFCSPDRSLQAKFSMVGFVNDSTGRVNRFEDRPQPPASKLTQLMSQDAQMWHDALDFSGGKLELPKCSYHLLSYKFKPNGSAYPFESPTIPDITVRNAESNVAIKRMSVFKPHKTLGHWKTPAGNGSSNLEKISQKAIKIAHQINISNLPRHLIWMMYMSIYISAIKYTLPQNYYPRKELDEAQCKSMRIIIGKCGFSRNTPLAVLYGPTHLGGAGLIQWSTLQGEGQLISFLQHWRTNRKIGLMVKIALVWAQLFAGISTPILNNNTQDLTYVPSRWIMSIRAFLQTINGQIHIHNPIIYPSQREHDQHIMDVVHQCQQFTPRQIEYINRCRIYLQVVTISDISTEDGSALQSGAYHGPPTSLYSRPTWLFPDQPKPHHQVWTYWLRFLDLNARPNSQLKQPLGPWLFRGDKLCRQWNEYRHKHGDTHYILQATKQKQWLCLTRNRKTWKATHLVNELPLQNLFPCRCNSNMVNSLKLYPHDVQIVPPATFSEFLLQQPDDTKTFLAHTHLYQDPYHIMAQLQSDETIYLTTDGASLPFRTAYGWVLASDDLHILAEGSGPAAGPTTSYRAESYGMRAGVLFLKLLCNFKNQRFNDLDILCDNQSLIRKAAQRFEYITPFPTSTTEADWDQREATHQLLLELKLEPTFTHVKGHQDEAGNELDYQARMNIRADELAGEYIYNNITPRPLVHVDQYSKCQLTIGHETITSNYRLAIRDAASAPALRDFLLSHCSPGATSNLIDWAIFSTANQKLTHLRVWSAKFIYNLLPTVTYDKTYSYDRPQCPYCPEAADTWMHHLACPSENRRSITKDFINDAQTHLQSINTCPDLLPAIITGLRTCLLHQSPTFGHHIPIFVHQTKIGWEPFLKGLWHKDWCLAQDAYLHETHQYSRSSTGTLWSISTITYFREKIHDIWIAHTRAVHEPLNTVSATKHRLLTRISSLQTQYSQCYPHHTHQFYLDTMNTSYSLTTLHNWISLHGSIVEQAIQHHRTTITLHQSLITTYFR